MHSLKILAISYEETLKLDFNTDKHVLYLGFKEFDKITFNGQYSPFGFKTVKIICLRKHWETAPFKSIKLLKNSPIF